jgi:ribosomal protein S18
LKAYKYASWKEVIKMPQGKRDRIPVGIHMTRARKRRNENKRAKKKVCAFCVDKVMDIDYKDCCKGEKVYIGKRQNTSEKNLRKLRQTSASADNGNKEGKAYSAFAVYS